MWTSYRPRMMALAIQDCNYSYQLAAETSGLSLSIPGTSLLDETMYFGTQSGATSDKLQETGLDLEPGHTIDIPGLKKAIGTIELSSRSIHQSGDHLLIVGEVTYMIGRHRNEQPLLSVGATTDGYKVLRKQGQHRLAIAKKLESDWLP